MTKILLWLVGLTAASIAAIAVYRVWPLLYPDAYSEAVLNGPCDLRGGSCTAVFPDHGKVRFSIKPREIPLTRPLRLEVFLEDIRPQGVEVDFSGVGMSMGYNRVRLQSVGAGRFQGQGMLPICVRDRMTWEAKVLLQTSHGYLVAPFRFETFRSGAPDS